MQKKRNNRCVCLKVQPNKLTCENLMWNFLPTKFKNLRKQENENMHFHHPVNSASRCMRCSLSGNYTLQISLLSHLLHCIWWSVNSLLCSPGENSACSSDSAEESQRMITNKFCVYSQAAQEVLYLCTYTAYTVRLKYFQQERRKSLNGCCCGCCGSLGRAAWVVWSLAPAVRERHMDHPWICEWIKWF